MSEQQEQLHRVSAVIGAAVLAFCRLNAGKEFRADQLRKYVLDTCGFIAPGSADRILRDLRQKKLVSYEVVNRRSSLYRLAESPRQHFLRSIKERK